MVDLMTCVQTILYGCTCILGFMISIPVGVTKSKFEGHCILYSKPQGWVLNDGGSCDFVIAFSVIGVLIYSLLCAVYHAFCFWRSRNDKSVSMEIWNIPFLGVNAGITVMVLIMACILSVGYSNWCNEFEDPYSCKSAQEDSAVWTYEGERFNPGKFHDRMSLAIASSWIAFIIFLVQIGLGVLRIRRKTSEYRRKSEEAKTAPAKSST